MNERIRQLLTPKLKEWGGDTGDDFSEELEKFAELIVRECIGCCESMPLIGPYKEVQDATLKDAAVQIREHFGVEE